MARRAASRCAWCGANLEPARAFCGPACEAKHERRYVRACFWRIAGTDSEPEESRLLALARGDTRIKGDRRAAPGCRGCDE